MLCATDILILIDEAYGFKKPLSSKEVEALEIELNPLWNSRGIHLTIPYRPGTHFFDNLSRLDYSFEDPITYNELKAILRVFTLKYLRKIMQLPDRSKGTIVAKKRDVYITFIVDTSSKYGFDRDVELMSVIRKKDFHLKETPYPVNV